MYTKKVDKCVRIRDKKKQKGKAHMSNKNSPAKYSEELKKPSSLFINPAKLMLTSRKNMASPLPLFLTGFENTPKFEWTKILF